MKKLYLAAALLIPVIFIFNACGKNNPAGPDTSTATATATSTNIIYIQPSITETSTITPTITVSPTFTVTMTETPFILDNFSDNDIYNNVNPSTNVWSSFVNVPDAVSNSYTINDFGITSAGYIDYGVAVMGTSYANHLDSSGNFFTTYGISTAVLFGPSTGINFNIYRHLIFRMVAYIWTLPAAGTYTFKVKFIDDNGRMVEQQMSGIVLGWNYQLVSLDINLFDVPSGVSAYTAADVLLNVVEIRWEYGIVSTMDNDKSESTMRLDNILLEK